MDFTALLADAAWTPLTTTRRTETGDVVVALKTIEGAPCLRGTMTVTGTSPNTLYDVVTDVPAAARFSSETLRVSRVLGRVDGKVHYYQHLDVPDWTLVADRFWVLEGWDASSGARRAFRWQTFAWRSVYPQVAAEVAASGAVEPTPNWGSWVFEGSDSGTRAVYVLCTNPAGSLPQWLAEAAATKTLPNTMADVAREAQRRGP